MPFSEGFSAIWRKRERRAENRVGGAAGMGGPEPAATELASPPAWPFASGSSIDFPPSMAESRRRNLRPGGREGWEAISGEAGRSVGDIGGTMDGIGELDLSGASHTSSRKG